MTTVVASLVGTDDVRSRLDGATRLRNAVRDHYAFLWRTLVRFGVREADAEDVAQRILQIVARRIDDIDEGKERAFMLQTAVRLASEVRRTQAQHKTVLDDVAIDAAVDSAPSPEERLAKEDARRLLYRALDELDLDLRTVVVLYELEEMGVSDIATMLGVPKGTVSSRLRRAREALDAIGRRVLRAYSDGRSS